MNILIFSQYFWPENFRINDLALGLSNRGHNITVVTGQPTYPDHKYFQSFREAPLQYNFCDDITIVRLPTFPRGKNKFTLILNYLSFLFSGVLFAFIRGRKFKNKYDLIFVYQLSPITSVIPAVFLSKILKIPLVMWILDLWPETIKSLNFLGSTTIFHFIAPLVSFIYKNCDRILVQSPGFIPSIQKRLDKKNVPVDFFSNWAEEEFDTIEFSSAPEILEDKGSFDLLFAGNLGEAQDFHTVLAAAHILKKRNIKFRIFVVGAGSSLDWVLREVKNLNLDNHFFYLGRFPINRMPDFYGSVDALFISLKSGTPFSETIPGKLYSYLAFGKPIIACIDGAAANLIKLSNSGVVSKAEDPVGLARNIEYLSNMSPADRAVFGECGRHYYVSNLSSKKAFETIERLFIEMLSGDLK